MSGYAAFRRVKVDLRETLRGLKHHAGTGVSGFRNEYLIALTHQFADARAASVIPALERFAGTYVNAELPGWFYYVFSGLKLMAPIKKEASDPSAAPDVRPIGVGEALRRAIHSSIMCQFKAPLAEYLWPQQVAVGVPAGLSLLIFGVRLALEVHPDWVAVKIDLRNAYNELKRARLLERLDAQPHLRALVPLYLKRRAHSAGPGSDD